MEGGNNDLERQADQACNKTDMVKALVFTIVQNRAKTWILRIAQRKWMYFRCSADVLETNDESLVSEEKLMYGCSKTSNQNGH